MGCYQSKNNSPSDKTTAEGNFLRFRSGSQQIMPIEIPERIMSSRRSVRIGEDRSNEGETELLAGEIQSITKNPKDYEMISKSLSKSFLFNSLSEESLNSIIEEFKLYKFSSKTIIFNQGLFGQNFFIINSGRVEVIVNGVVKKILTKGEHFGELALLHDSNRTASIKTIEQSSFWTLARGSFKKMIVSINLKKFEENVSFMKNVELFSSFSQSQKDVILSLMVTQDFNDGDQIVHEGDPGDLLYIIQRGTVSCSKEGKEIRRLEKGEFFGEHALIYNTPRTATVVAIGRCTMLSLCRNDLVSAFGSQLQQIIYKNTLIISIENSKAFRTLSKAQIDSLCSKIKVTLFNFEDVVIPKGSPKKDSIYFILKGCLKTSEQTYGLYRIIGDSSAMRESGSFWKEDFKADCHSYIGIISKNDLELAIGGKIKSIKTQNEVIKVMKKVNIFRNLPLAKLRGLANIVKVKRYKKDSKIFVEGEIGETFYIVKDGQVEIFRGSTSIRVITKLDYFGERSIILDERRTATVVAKSRVSLWTLAEKDFLSIIDESIRKQLLIRILLQNDRIELKELLFIKELGKGMFGNVFLVNCTSNNSFYALKTVNKEKAKQYEIYENLVQERKILLQVDHPFIVKLVKTFKDPSRLYFLMEFIEGQDLFDTIRSIGILNSDSARFYISCIVLILENLHEQKIIYRDLKPENIMIDKEGYPKLIDFGTAKIIESRTFTLVGTPHYMAPEIIKGSGYGFQADVWSLGIMLYEFVCGGVPFGENEEDPYRIYSIVLDNRLKFPNFLQIKKHKELIEKLLDSNPAHRYSTENIKADPWFSNTPWESLLCKKISPPHKPKLQNLSQAHQQALKSTKSLKAVIQEHESLDRPTANQSDLPPAPENWDIDF